MMSDMVVEIVLVVVTKTFFVVVDAVIVFLFLELETCCDGEWRRGLLTLNPG
jgi:hypothetical protein